MANFEFIQEANRTLEPKLIQKIQSTSTAIFKVVEIPNSTFITILLCDKKKIRELNLAFRKIDKATDVLSWKHESTEKRQNFEFLKEFPFGEIAICDKICESQARENGWDFETEFLRLFIHGITHLAEYTHKTESDEQEMLAKEEEILALFDLQKIYA